MTIKIRKKAFFLYLWCPTSLIKAAVKMWARHAPEQDLGCDLRVEVDSKQQINDIAKAIKSAKKQHGRLAVIDVKSADGTNVKITL